MNFGESGNVTICLKTGVEGVTRNSSVQHPESRTSFAMYFIEGNFLSLPSLEGHFFKRLGKRETVVKFTAATCLGVRHNPIRDDIASHVRRVVSFNWPALWIRLS